MDKGKSIFNHNVFFSMTEQTLLQATEAEIGVFLAELTGDEVANYSLALALLWQVYPNPTIRETTQQLLENYQTEQERQVIASTLGIFDSIISCMPWAGDYRALQQKNYAVFESDKAPYEELIVKSPVLLEQYLDLGRRLYKLFDLLPEAKTCFESILAHHAELPEALYALGRIVEQERNYKEALVYYQRCIAQDPTHIYAHLQLGILYVEQEQAYDKAIEYYQIVLELEPFMVETHVRMAEAQRALGDWSRAKQFIDIALDVNPHQEQALNLLGWIQWRDEENVEAALATFEKGVDHQIHGDSSLLLASLGQLYQKQLGDMKKARLYYEKSLAANLHQQETLQYLMGILEEHYQDYGTMAQYYERYLTNSQYEPSIHTAYAAFSVKYLNDYETALEQLSKAFKIEQNYPPAVAIALQINQQLSMEEGDIYDEAEDDFSGGGAAGDN